LFGSSTLLGAIRLGDLMPVNLGDANVPGLNTRIIRDERGIPIAVETTLDWSTTLTTTAVFASSRAGAEPTLTLHGQMYRDLRNQDASRCAMSGELRDFALRFFGTSPFLAVRFRRLTFTSGTNQNFGIHPEIAGIEFSDALQFVRTLADKFKLGRGF